MREDTRNILPFFIPHLGCPHQCIFCNQFHVSGEESCPKQEDISAAITKWEGDTLPEVAFYGGSFSGLSQGEQEYFLRPAFEALKRDRVGGIRISTRPDYINEKILDFLKAFGVSTVELGVQSMDDEVLSKSFRGHSFDDVFRAVRLLKKKNFKVGVQLMPGLPGDTREKSINGTIILAKMKPDLARIYPTLVLKDTLLHKLFLEEKYSPLSLDAAIELSRDMLAVFINYGVNVIRIGLQPTKDIAEGVQVAAGPFHPAFGELAKAALFREQMVWAVTHLFQKGTQLKKINLFVSHRDCSLAAGHKRENLHYLKEHFSLDEIKIIARKELSRGDLGVASLEKED
ncbi:MAG: radical SAM protein, partial [Desulfitobacteriaceae bacterium]|nr:radical SAM protein [Desulfitobacteriaceae bacterium]